MLEAAMWNGLRTVMGLPAGTRLVVDSSAPTATLGSWSCRSRGALLPHAWYGYRRPCTYFKASTPASAIQDGIYCSFCGVWDQEPTRVITIFRLLCGSIEIFLWDRREPHEQACSHTGLVVGTCCGSVGCPPPRFGSGAGALLALSIWIAHRQHEPCAVDTRKRFRSS